MMTPPLIGRRPVLDTGLGLPPLAHQSPTPDRVRGSEDETANRSLRSAAQGFEQIFLRQMIGAMRAGSLGDPLFGSPGEDQFRDLFDARLAEGLSQQDSGLGIGELIIAQLERGRSHE
jgi:peptidoglycan hydrolase FlgJ